MRIENRDGEGECYQINARIKVKYDEGEKKLVSLKIDGREVGDDGVYHVAMQSYHFNNCAQYLGVTPEELTRSGKQKTVTTSVQQVLEEWLKTHQNENREVEGRLAYKW